jgi:hypothetical protein
MKIKHLPFIALCAMTLVMTYFEYVVYDNHTAVRYWIPFVALAAGIVGAFTFNSKK